MLKLPLVFLLALATTPDAAVTTPADERPGALRAAFCSGNDYAALLATLPGEPTRLFWTDLRGPLTDDSVQATEVTLASTLTLTCSPGSALVESSDEALRFAPDNSGKLVATPTGAAPARTTTGATTRQLATLTVGCSRDPSGTGPAFDTFLVNQQTNSRRGEIGRKGRYRLWRFQEIGDEGETVVRLVLRERVSERVERLLVLAEGACATPGSQSQPFSRATRAASMRLATPSLEIASER